VDRPMSSGLFKQEEALLSNAKAQSENHTLDA
jgi:hypothetical protein